LTPERWQQISRIFKSAISLDSDARAAYLGGVDESLREEVEKLLESHKKASDEKFIDGNAAEANAQLLITDDELGEEPSRRLSKGQQLGSYLILDSLGVGVFAVAALLLYEHSIVHPGDLRRLDTAFFTMNGIISVTFFAFVLADSLF